MLGVAYEAEPYAGARQDHNKTGARSRELRGGDAGGRNAPVLLPFKATGKAVSGMPAAEQMRAFLGRLSAHNVSVLDDPGIRV